MEPVSTWGVLGLVLLGVEMATGTFYVLWFGVAALLLAVIVWLAPTLSVAVQLGLFAVLSLSSLFLWRRYYKHTDLNSRVGQSQGEEIGRVGLVYETVTSTQNGRIRFPQGVLGSREWVAIADHTIEVGQSAEIIAVEGNHLRVKVVSH